MTQQEVLIAEIEGLKAVVAALVGQFVLISGPNSDFKEKIHDLAILNAQHNPVIGPGISTEAVSARTLASIDGILRRHFITP